MIKITLFPIDPEHIINLDQIVEIERFDEVPVETDQGEEILYNAAVIKMHNGSEVVLNEEDANKLFAHAYDQLDLAERVRAAMEQKGV